MSVRRQDFGTELEIYVDSNKTFQFTIINPSTGLAQNLTDTDVYNTGSVKIYKPDGTILITTSVTYTDRINGIVEFTIVDTESIIANAGNWIGDLELINDTSDIIDQQKFNFNILVSY